MVDHSRIRSKVSWKLKKLEGSFKRLLRCSPDSSSSDSQPIVEGSRDVSQESSHPSRPVFISNPVPVFIPEAAIDTVPIQGTCTPTAPPDISTSPIPTSGAAQVIYSDSESDTSVTPHESNTLATTSTITPTTTPRPKTPTNMPTNPTRPKRGLQSQLLRVALLLTSDKIKRSAYQALREDWGFYNIGPLENYQCAELGISGSIFAITLSTRPAQNMIMSDDDITFALRHRYILGRSVGERGPTRSQHNDEASNTRNSGALDVSPDLIVPTLPDLKLSLDPYDAVRLRIHEGQDGNPAVELQRTRASNRHSGIQDSAASHRMETIMNTI
ncbi:hypothetical protein B0J11DRAFT_503449 [Dendryphion nanum]|uniref:Uncharacterized protein n=1 Tax=Dendryphion nanum TaxID=256645 RepID=A0A9P9E7W0_9PLEO|nr:hypothetical protein B0J11DRAFT_503449 [Dendryphion nanum]